MNLELPGYNLVRAYNPTNTKRGSFCIYYHYSLPLKVIDIQFASECINFEIRIGGKFCSFLYLYRSPSQTRNIFETFDDNFELTLDTIINKNQFLIVALGDFNAKTTNWYKNDINSYEGLKIDTITSQFGLQLLINEHTHLTANSSSCIDLIFISQPNLVMESGVHSSLHLNCHHHIVFAKINLKICYPPSYEREIWHYENANAGLICRSIDQFPWHNRFSNLDVNQKVHLFNQIIKNILCNFIPNEAVTCDDRDPPWINNKIKGLIQEKNIAKKCYFQNNKDIQLFRRFQFIQNLLTATIEKSKEQFYYQISTKLMDPTISPKAYWSILKTFLNNKKLPYIPPIYHNNNYITDFKEKAQIFSHFFAKQCTLVANSSKLRTNFFKRTNTVNDRLSPHFRISPPFE